MNDPKFMENINAKNEYNEWKTFALKGEMTQMAIAFILGTAFTKVVNSISNNLIMPFLNYGLSFTGDGWRKWKISPISGLEIEVGMFLGSLIDFLLISIVLYIMYRKLMKSIWPKKKKSKIECIETKDCPLCFEKVNWKATKCPYCTGPILMRYNHE